MRIEYTPHAAQMEIHKARSRSGVRDIAHELFRGTTRRRTTG